MQDESPSTSSGSSNPFLPRFARALLLLIAAGAAHAWVDRAVRKPATEGNTTPAVWSGASPTLVPPSERQAELSRATESRVPIVTDWVVVEPDDAPSEAPTQRQARRESDVVGTTGRVATLADDEPPPTRSTLVEDEPATRSEPEPRAVKPAISAALPATPKTVETTHVPAPVEVSHPEPAAAERASLAAPVEPDQRQLVRDLLQRYVIAFERLDVDAAKAIWPTVDGDALRRAFSQLEAQHLRFETCGITIAGAGANARCRGEATFHPRIGSRPLHLSSREWNFELARAESGWQIVDARVR